MKNADEAARVARCSHSPRGGEAPAAPCSPEERIRRLKELQGIGARLVGPQTIEEIDARINEFRGDD